jgi:hypothetical protein
MIKIGLVSAATYGPGYKEKDAPRTPGSFHGTAFASTYNGCDEKKAKQWEWTFVAAEKHIEDAKVVKVWDPHREWSERLAEVRSVLFPKWQKLLKNAQKELMPWLSLMTALALSGNMQLIHSNEEFPHIATSLWQ